MGREEERAPKRVQRHFARGHRSALESSGLLDVLAYPNPRRYPNQKVLVVAVMEYVYLIPHVEEPDHLFLKTIIPSRKATRDYRKRGDT